VHTPCHANLDSGVHKARSLDHIRQGVARLWWGSNMLDSALETGLMFASDRALIEQDCADADLFPAGAVFISRRGETIGSVQSLKCAPLQTTMQCYQGLQRAPRLAHCCTTSPLEQLSITSACRVQQCHRLFGATLTTPGPHHACAAAFNGKH